MHRYISGALLIIFLLGCLGGCGGVGAPAADTAPGGLELSSALHELDALAVPPGVDAARFAELKAALHSMLLEHTPARSVSAAPDSDLSRVDDLSGTADDTCAMFHWSYRNQGDYDQNGIVGITDLVPLAIHLNKTASAPDWALARVADGDNDGIVALPDLLPIAINLARRVVGYRLEYNSVDDPEGAWTQVADVLFNTSTVPDGELRQFDFTLADAQTGYYRVKPYDAETSGIPSEAVYVEIAQLPAASAWPMYGHDAQHTGQSEYVGPQTAKLKWTFQSTGPGQEFGAAAAGVDDTVYVGAGADLLALNADGTLKWRAPGLQPNNPAVGPDGTIYTTGETGYLYAYDTEGNHKWTYRVGRCMRNLSLNGNVIACIDESGDTVYVINTDGTLKWQYPTLMSPSNPIVCDDGSVIIGSNQGIIARNADSSKKWIYNFPTTSLYGPYISDDGSVYAVDDDLRLYCLTPDGTTKWINSEFNFTTKPVVNESGWVYFGSDSQLIACNSLGVQAWTFTAPAKIVDTPVVCADGTIIFMCTGEILYAVNPDGSLRYSTSTGVHEYAALSPAPEGGAFISASDGWFYSYDATGVLQWKYGNEGGPFSASCALSIDAVLYATCGDGYLYAIQPDGTLKWQIKDTGAKHSTPAVGANGTVYYFSSSTGLHALNPESGTELWRYYCQNSSGYSSPTIGPDGTVYIGGYKELSALSPSGDLKWTAALEGLMNSSPALALDGTVYGTFSTATGSGQLQAFDSTGILKWSISNELLWLAHDSPCISFTGIIYMCYGNVYALQACSPSGELIWRFEPAAWRSQSSVSIAGDGTIYTGYNGSILYAVNMDGSEKWVYYQDAVLGSDSKPAIGADGTVYFGASDSNVYALNPDGSLKWSYATDDVVEASPVIGADGTLYIGSNDGRLYAFHD